MRYHFHPGAADAPALLVLHGTGGGPDDLLGLARHLNPASPVLAPAGPVSENGMARWFRRLAEGVFDFEDVRRRAGELADFVRATREEHALTGRLVAVGFSNGANIAGALALLHPDVVSEAALFAGMNPLPEVPETDLSASRVFLCNGTADAMAPIDSAGALAAALRSRGAAVTAFRHAGGHHIPAEAADAAADWLNA
ncbi:phospholipase/carboxylesterase [Crossiella equi]|uniref:Phospholipase/carboxylesterase n=1 Tax=Crossiella equi TaxID=130796 RepID=A0ABS5A6X9_9PSEU|nr:alpha/beta hydrolase [Crossiella equi]MBP2472017.1 phospholipase/carboxylesterase [Crossiella equi]